MQRSEDLSLNESILDSSIFMSYRKVYWLLDEVFARTHLSDWPETVDLTRTLIELIGNERLQHVTLNPIDSFRKAVGKLLRAQDPIRVSSIIDMSGWIGYGLKPIYPNVEIVTDFSISRLRDVSTSVLKNVGFIINRPIDDLKKKALELDLSRVLLVDDAFVTGATSRAIMDIFGINPRNITHLSLFANIGNFISGENVLPGAVRLFEESGGKVFYGDSLRTPQDTAEHVLDFFDHPFIERGFPSAMKLRASVGAEADYGQQLHRFLITDESARDVFPRLIQQVKIDELTGEGRFLANPNYSGTEGAIYSLNPTLWSINDFWQMAREDYVRERGVEVLGILARFHSLTRNPVVVQDEIGQRLESEANNLLAGNLPERGF